MASVSSIDKQAVAETPAAAPPLHAPRKMKLLHPVEPRTRLFLGVGFFLLFLLFWTFLTAAGIVAPHFLASPLQALKAAWKLFAEFGFLNDVGMTVWRVMGGFLLAAVIAVPLGIAMGAYKPIEAVFEPFVSFARYLPASAFIPLLIMWVGIGEAQKLSIIFIGCFFQLTLMVMMIVSNARRDLVEAAYTLGSTDSSVIRRVLLPGAAPEIAEALRQVLGLGWTYVVVAELIGAASGIGHMIMDSQALMATDNIIAGIVIIGLVGLTSDLLFKKLNQLLFPWSLMR
ncbi:MULTISPECIES: ABC transporter permease [Delftia]|uniref:ABC transporter permease n=2 Tax=Delftia TaxID=80865 RepID=A0A7T2S0I2_DELAC|nr:ABC transporter permease [Delftia sp. UME58]MBL8358814.1 ABC transporter permease [Delftia acidovorans]QPS06756.1 ABC transporter permease [Delftia acidovorans]